jgi:hypothetical protein
MNITELFIDIQPPTESDTFQFSAIIIPGFQNHRIAKDKNGKPTLLLSSSDTGAFKNLTNMKLQNVSVLYNVKCKINQNESIIEKIFTSICFTGTDDSLKMYFLRVCNTILTDLENLPSQANIQREISLFVELFRLAGEPQLKTTQGLWAEVFLISESKTPALLIKSWHHIPEEKFDFSNGVERIEVKSNSLGTRIHNFAMEQLCPAYDSKTIIASIYVKQISLGKSIEELVNDVTERLSGQFELIDKLRIQVAITLGKNIDDSIRMNFDYQLAKESLQFYRIEDIPKVSSENVPPTVSDIHFKSDLSAIKPIDLSTLNGSNGLFDSL